MTLSTHFVLKALDRLVIGHLELHLPDRTVRRFGLHDIPACGQNDEVLRAHRLDAESLAEDLAAAMRGGPPD